MEFFIIVRSVVAADHDAGADGSSCEEHDDHVDDTCCGPNSGEGVGADEVSDDEAVYGVVELLKEMSDHKRNREHDEKFRDGTGCHVHGFLFFRGMVHSGFSLA